MTIEATSQSLTPGRRVELFDFDATALGGPLYHFVNVFVEAGSLTWQGNTYIPQPIKTDGFEVNGKGSLPTPTLVMSNVLRLPGNLIAEIGDPLGAVVTRWVTFSNYLDDGEDADPNAHFPPEIYEVQRKRSQNNAFVEFELSASIDQQGKMIPGRQILRDTCLHTYRVWDADAGAFDYTDASCPFTGAGMFTFQGVATANPVLDVCNKQLVAGCRLRFGLEPLPTRAFPAVARNR